jgi:hypothetical protein
MSRMAERVGSNSVQQIRDTKSRTIVWPTTFLHICYLTWQDFKYVNGILEEWVKKSEAELAATEAEIRQIRELLDEE